MAMTKDQLLAKAMDLEPRERELLAEELWLSLDDVTKDEVWDAWTVEIRKRLGELDRGEVQTIPGEQAVREARRLIRKKRSG